MRAGTLSCHLTSAGNRERCLQGEACLKNEYSNGVMLIKEINRRFLELLLVDICLAEEGLCKSLKGSVYLDLFFISWMFFVVCVHAPRSAEPRITEAA